MRFTHRGIELHVGVALLVAWSAWALTGALTPLPPWRAGALLGLEEQAAARLATPPAGLRDWSIDVGGAPQAAALGAGWSESESLREGGRRRSFVWIDARRAEIRFAAPRWEAAWLSVEASPLQALAPLEVEAALDGDARGTLSFPVGWTVARLPLGMVDAGRHVVELRPRAEAVPPG